ncbi:hypothetical protein D0Z00_001298 [Geotrichum galactomycetum]|uniref:Uncharacterized protein n=1 Tax=Geotrichum galactomycetum TaxID=27317 RepID=A0ACB6V7E6_9ASCO|nr:hypothetical protein D0Z00_001298 [Geotrichum candidum]
MLLKTTLAASILATCVSAFSNTSPHIFFATNLDLQGDSKYAEAAAQRQEGADSSFVAQSSDFDRAVYSSLEGCPVDAYIFIDIPGLHSSDLSSSSLLRDLYNNAPVKFAYPYVTSSEKGSDKLVAKSIAENCNAEVISVNTRELAFEPYVDAQSRVITAYFDALPAEENERKVALESHLNFALNSIVHSLPSPNYAVIITSSADEASVKVGRKEAQATQKKKTSSKGSLFTRYAFFGTGIFEGTLISLFLIYALFTALSWLSDLKISYRAFEKQPGQPSKAQ